jgi:hypothetical protein
VSGPTESDVVIACFGEDFVVDIGAHIVVHEVFRPGDQAPGLVHAAAQIHGTGTGMVSGTPVIFNENVSGTVDMLPNGDQVFHTVSPGEVVTAGPSPNLEFTIELQVVTAADGTEKNVTLNAQAKCGSVHEHEHGHA